MSQSAVTRRRFLKSAAAIGASAAAETAGFAGLLAPDRPIRVGLIGTDGHIGVILDSIPKISNTELVAFAKSKPDDNAERIQRHGAFTARTRIYTAYQEMLEREALDVVGVCLPYYRNAEASIAAAKKRIHIMSEKPVATTLADLDRLQKAVQEYGIRLSALFTMRSEPAFLAARTAVGNGLIGDPILLYAQKSYKWGRSRPDFYKKRETYGGTIPWIGIHAIDYMRWTSGREYARVAARHGNRAHPAYPECEDNAGLIFELVNGGTAVCNLDYLRPETAPTHGDDRLRIAGTEGVLEVIGNQNRTTVVTSQSGPQELELPSSIDLFADFIAELRGQGQHIIGPTEAIHVTRISLIAREAADSGQWMEV